MSTLVTTGAMIMCAAGSAPVPFTAIGQIFLGAGMAGNISSVIPMVDIPTFGSCTILTAETLGVDTVCVPAPAGTWIPGVPTVLMGEMCALDQTSILMCSIGGAITVQFPGQISAIAAA